MLKKIVIGSKVDIGNPHCPGCGIPLVKIRLEIPLDPKRGYYIYQCRSCKNLYEDIQSGVE